MKLNHDIVREVLLYLEDRLELNDELDSTKITTSFLENIISGKFTNTARKRGEKVTRLEILSQYYVTQTDIQKLLQRYSVREAKKIYEMVSEMENQELGAFQRMTTR